MKKIIMLTAMALLIAAAPVWAQSSQPSDESDISDLLGQPDSTDSGGSATAPDTGLLGDGGSSSGSQPSSSGQPDPGSSSQPQ